MNCGLGARIFGFSSATAHSCPITAIPPPIAAGFPPNNDATTTSPAPSAASKPSAFTSRSFYVAYRLLLPLFSISLHPIVDAHKPRKSTHEGTDDREQRSGVDPPIEKPAAGAEQQNGDREVQRHAEVLVALTVTFDFGTFVFWRGSHVAPET